MNSNQTFSILVWVLRNRMQNGKTPVYLRVTINGERVEISANRQATICLWDAKIQKMKGNSAEAVNINTHIEAIKTSLNRHHSRLVTLGKNSNAANAEK